MNAMECGQLRREMSEPAQPLRERLMDAIEDELEQQAENTVIAYADHVATWIDNEEVFALARGLIEMELERPNHWEMVRSKVDYRIAEPIDKLVARIRSTREEFIAEEVYRRLKEALAA